MSMSYWFSNDSDNYALEDNFPDDLGWFCERVGAWSDESEFKQLEKKLEIDLKLLDHTQYNWEDEDAPGSIKTNVSEFKELIENFVQKINASPTFHNSITYRENNADLCKQYLESTELRDDLSTLSEVMNLYEVNKIEEFEICYG